MPPKRYKHGSRRPRWNNSKAIYWRCSWSHSQRCGGVIVDPQLPQLGHVVFAWHLRGMKKVIGRFKSPSRRVPEVAARFWEMHGCFEAGKPAQWQLHPMSSPTKSQTWVQWLSRSGARAVCGACWLVVKAAGFKPDFATWAVHQLSSKGPRDGWLSMSESKPLGEGYRNFLDGLQRFFAAHGGLHVPTTSSTEIREGCPVAAPTSIIFT